MKKLPILILSAALLLTIMATCGFQNSKPTTMIHFNKDDYAAAWKTIDSLDQQGLPKSALEKVEALYLRAKNDENPSQIIKCLIYQGKYINQLEEDGLVKAIQKLQEEAEKESQPTKAILQSMLAEAYINYLNNNRYRFRDRTTTVDFDNTDIQTWTIQQLVDKATSLYLASLEFEGSKQIPVEEFDAITIDQKNADTHLRPTLYDFLIHRVIDHFMNEQTYLTDPAYKFYIDQKEVFGTASEFVNHKFETKDSSSLKFKNLLLFQDLLAFHLKDKDKTALINADLKRLKFAYDNAVLEDKENLYLAALENLEKKHINHPESTLITYNIAQIYQRKGNQFSSSKSEADQWSLKKAHELSTAAVKRFPKSYGASLCRQLIAQIKSKSLGLKTEEVNLPDYPILARIDYQNVQKVWVKVIRVLEKEAKSNNRMNQEELIKKFNSYTSLKTWTLDLIDEGDYQMHSTEFKIDPLPFGHYLIMVSDNSDFEIKGNAVAYLYTDVSNLAYWHRTDHQNKTQFVVVHRNTGDPLEGVKTEFFVQEYNRRTREHEYKLQGTSYSDNNGFVKTELPDRARFSIKLTKGQDQIHLNDGFANYSYGNYQNAYKVTHFFTDRAIYRPGQTVYFKALVLDIDEDQMPQIITNQEVMVTFHDANHQEVETLKLRTNDYGTINGSFVAPKSGLLGQMSIRSSIGNGSKYFRVEEYKRPKFEVGFDPVKGSYKLGEMVKVTGNAKAYAGSNIDGALVRYRVVRNVAFPYYPWWRWGRWPYPQGNAMEITNGETTTDETGAFTIDFEAIPDKTVSTDKKPQYSYQVVVDVVDITGETRSGDQYVNVGVVALDVDIQTPITIDTDSLKVFIISSKNLNGVFEPAKGEIVINELKSPGKVFNNRYWEYPDKPLMSQSEFNQYFPRFSYQNEDKIEFWPVKKEVLKVDFDTEKNKTLDLDNQSFPAGVYALILKTKDQFGTPVELTKFFTVYSLKNVELPDNLTAFHFQEKSVYEPEEIARYYTGSAKAPVKVLYEIEQDNRLVHREWVEADKIKKLQLSILEKHRGNLHYYLSFAKENRSYLSSHTISVPWSNKDLKIEYATFRDKLYPGQQEEWQIKISGNKGEKVAAEMLAGMYDASLDEFVTHNWYLNLFPTSYPRRHLRTTNFDTQNGRLLAGDWQPIAPGAKSRIYPQLNWFGFPFYATRSRHAIAYDSSMPKMAMKRNMQESPAPDADMTLANGAVELSETVVSDVDGASVDKEANPQQKEQQSDNLQNVKIRTNLNETVFFFPDLMTDKDGNIIIKFTMNEALTRWKFMGLAHTSDLKTAITNNTVVTQKDLMVLPNPPRFMREGDEIEFTAKVSNLTDKEMKGTAVLELYNALTMEKVDGLLANQNNSISFTAPAGQSDRLAWKLKIPFGKVPVITHRVIAKAGDFSDGEESSLPVLTNRMLVTESKPLPVRGNQTKTFTFESLKNANSNTLQHEALTLEFTSNPAWYAVQALPYLMEYPYDCTEQIFNRYYANSLATSVANSHPRIKSVFKKWADGNAMLSNLTKNQELKSALLEETPWVLNAQSEETQKKNIALLFDLNRMSDEQEQAIAKLTDRQMSNGGFSWFPGGRDSWYITQYMVEGMGHLDRLGVKSIKSDDRLKNMLSNSVRYIDERVVEYFEELEKLVKAGKAKWEDDHLSSMAVHYLYARSFFLNQSFEGRSKDVFEYFLTQADQYWLKRGIYQEGMLALALYRSDRKETPVKILKSLKERSLNHEEMGMYWKYDTGYYWYQLPIETHALMIEVFDEVAKDKQAVDDLKVWLLKTKQTTHWKTTKATSSAVYALLMRGENWLLSEGKVSISFPASSNSKWEVQFTEAQNSVEAGTGYFKSKVDGGEVSSAMSTITVKNPNNHPAWGAVYWQYFEDLDKIKTFEETPLTLKKQLFKVTNSDRGPVMKPLANGATLEPGDKLHVRIELRVDRVMEYVHMKDMRASGFEPINVLSQYNWKGGLGYYESTRDASTNFFFSYLPKGTHVFEYPLRVQHKGDFSNGITTIQCMYAPEFTSHSEGIRVEVE